MHETLPFSDARVQFWVVSLCVKSAVFIYCLCFFNLINHHRIVTDETFAITL
jgi:hypothetical protein